MAMESGTRVGIYEVTGKLGEGGMGQVYRAHDASLDRDVALKVLPESFLADPDRLARFQREAKVLASLNHPNIGHIYGLEAAGDGQALVLELIEGPTLADRIAEGPIPVDEALAIAGQIADALESAHAQGIIHRDLKPANVKVRSDGTVKVLDFGLAKAVTTDPGGNDASDAPTLSITGATQMGMVVGTAAYMAPEQARGKVVDKRADIWAFGVVLYEMLTGKRAFGGEDTSLTLASVMKDDPEMEALPATLSASAKNCLEHCLQKDPQKRIRDAGDVQLAMAGIFETSVATDVSTVGTEHRRLPLWQQPLGIVVGTVAVAAAAVVGSLALLENERVGGIVRTLLLLEPGEGFTNFGRRVLDISPDGRYVAYQANLQIFLRQMDELEPTPIRGTDGTQGSAGRTPTFSPDNQWLAFYHEAQVKKVSVTGGSPVALADVGPVFGISWSPDGNDIYVGQGNLGIVRVPAVGGAVETMVSLDGEGAAHGPQLLPGGEWMLFTLRSDVATTWSEAQIVVQSLVTGERRTLVNNGTDGRYLASGHITYVDDGDLLALPFDASSIETIPGPVPMVTDVAMAGGQTGSAHFSVSDTGTLIYAPTENVWVGGASAGGTPLSELVWVERDGTESPTGLAADRMQMPALSPDGGRVAYVSFDGETDVWVYDFERQTNQRLSFDPAIETTPVWHPDGSRVAYWNQLSGTLVTNADGTGQPEVVHSGSFVIPATFTPDGKTLLANPNGNDVAAISVGADSVSDNLMMLIESEFSEASLRLSPDGNWLAYQSDESGEVEVYVRPFPDVQSGLWQVSRSGGRDPIWSGDGSALFYLGGSGDLTTVTVETDPTFIPSVEEALFDASSYFSGGFRYAFTVDHEGQRFLMMKPAGVAVAENPEAEAGRGHITVVQNWFEELEQRVPVP